MKILRLFLILSAICVSWQGASAQRIHEILFCNTIDSSIGKSVEVDNDRALDEIGCIGGYIGYEVVEYVYQGKDCTRQNLMNVLNSLNCSNQDIVFFYYSGHGVHANTNYEDKLPQMCMNTNIQNQFVAVHEVDEILAKKNPKLRIIMTDCCNSIDQSGIVQPKEGLAMERGITVIKGNDQANYRKLFAEPRGSVIVTSSKLGQSSLGNDVLGGWFSYVFWNLLLKECTNSTTTPTWNSLMEKAQKNTLEMTARVSHDQEPYYVIDLNGHSSAASTTTTTATTQEEPSSVSHAIGRLLKETSMSERKKQADALRKEYFGNGQEATFITVGRNLKTVVDYEDLDAYLERLIANKKIVRINVIKEKTNSKGKKFITVTEMRNE